MKWKQKTFIITILVFCLLSVSNVFGAEVFEQFNASNLTRFQGLDETSPTSDAAPPTNTLPPFAASALAANELSDINFSDDNWDQNSIGAVEGFMMVNASVPQGYTATNITGIWEGYMNAVPGSDNITFYFWNNTGSSWWDCDGLFKDAGGSGTEATYNCNITSNTADFLDENNNIYFMIYGQNGDDSGVLTMFTDYMAVEGTFNTPAAGGGSCSPTIDVDWSITSAISCGSGDGNQDVGSGAIAISSSGSLSITSVIVQAASASINSASGISINGGELVISG